MISQPPVKDYVPMSWGSLVSVKKEHYKALAHYYVALGVLDHKGDFSNKTSETLQFLHEEDEDDKGANLIEIRVPKNQNESRYLGIYKREVPKGGAFMQNPHLVALLVSYMTLRPILMMVT